MNRFMSYSCACRVPHVQLAQGLQCLAGVVQLALVQWISFTSKYWLAKDGSEGIAFFQTMFVSKHTLLVTVIEMTCMKKRKRKFEPRIRVRKLKEFIQK